MPCTTSRLICNLPGTNVLEKLRNELFHGITLFIKGTVQKSKIKGIIFCSKCCYLILCFLQRLLNLFFLPFIFNWFHNCLSHWSYFQLPPLTSLASCIQWGIPVKVLWGLISKSPPRSFCQSPSSSQLGKMKKKNLHLKNYKTNTNKKQTQKNPKSFCQTEERHLFKL